MSRIKMKFILGLALVSVLGCSNTAEEREGPSAVENEKFAVISDIHFHDVYAEFQDGNFSGIPNSKSGKNATIRTMDAQMNSTRLFNENYFAFIAAMDDVAEKGIKNVILPGDFTDDGQPINVRGIVQILDEYQDKYGLRYYATLGNHDPVSPYGRPGGKEDFLGEDGMRQPIFSKGRDYKASDSGEHTVIQSEEVYELGYKEIMDGMNKAGFYPSEDYLYWETPFSTYSLEEYDYEKALEEADLKNRVYEIYTQGSGGKYKESGYSNSLIVPDASYLVEPVEGIWLLSIDANVFVPKDDISNHNDDFKNYNSPSNAGYNKVITHKKFLIDWVRDVAEKAKENNKTLITFSHYPLVEFYNNAAEEIEELFGEGKFDLKRVPDEETSKIFAEAGIRIHLGGHMHFNDTSVRHYSEDEFLVNIQVPSLAAYIPAYKVLTLKSENKIEVETVILDDVDNFDELFEHYQTEYDYLKASGYEKIWNKDILKAQSYYELNDWHIKELTRLRFLPSDWPEDIKNLIFNLTGLEMLALSQMSSQTEVGDTGFKINSIDDLEFKREFNIAKTKAVQLAKGQGISEDNLNSWNGFDLITDFYRLRNADQLALRDVSVERIKEYKLIGDSINSNGINLLFKGGKVSPENSIDDIFKVRFKGILGILDKFTSGEASEHFIVDLEDGDINNLK